MSHKINFDFSRKKTSVTTAEFLLGSYNPNVEETELKELKDNFQKALEGNSIKVKEANLLLQHLLTAMMIDDDTGDEVINKELKKDLIPNDPVAGGSGIGKALVTKAPVEEKIPTAKTKCIIVHSFLISHYSLFIYNFSHL